ncbi:restriction endonuclease subunit S [Nocardia acidivorans]|uniref:restriction endonuclease subunit S n=1 Tax=Nocardia acidivorans TaxID=404580 RepID=UPI00082DB3EF|nr:restriction endonuclease subunit S [Nocardia acidivorans]
MKFYAEMKPTDSPWLGEVPAHWELSRFRYEATINGGQVDPREEPWSGMTLIAPNHIESNTGRIISVETAEEQGADSGKYLVEQGQLVYSKIRPALNKVAIAETAALCSADMYAMSFAARIEPRFALYYFLARPFHTFATIISTRVKMPKVNREELADAPWLVPPLDEQRAIVSYLDCETARIDTLIEEQQRLIEMLRERRRALRVHVALHGTASTDEVESPLPWANQVPSSWRVVPLTSVAQLESGHTPSRSRADWWTDCYVPWVSLHDVGRMRGIKYLQDTVQRISDAGIANSSARLLPAHTVVLSRDATVGRTAIMGVPMATSQHFAAWICGPLLDPEYLWVLFGDAMQPFFDSFQNGSTIRTIGMGDLKAFRIPLPPVDEQRRIVEYLDRKTAEIDELIVETENFIGLARERRGALITAAVTGQIDVREMV